MFNDLIWLSNNTINANTKRCFLPEFNTKLLSVIKCTKHDYSELLKKHIDTIRQRGLFEKDYWENEKSTIQSYSKEEAITELIKSKKINQKIAQIIQFVNGLSYD